MAPVALRIEVAEPEAILLADRDRGNGAGDLAGDEGLAATRALMVEEDAVRGVHPVGLAVVHRDPVGVDLGGGIGAARVEGRLLVLGDGLHLAVEFAGRGLVDAGLLREAQDADRLQQPKLAERVGIGGVFRRLEADLHMGLGAEVVDLVGLGLLQDADQVRRIRQVAVVQLEAQVRLVRVLVQMVHAAGVEGGGAALDPVHRVALRQEKLGEVGAILARDAGDQCDLACFRHCIPRYGRRGQGDRPRRARATRMPLPRPAG